jgi:hypothetical protein
LPEKYGYLLQLLSANAPVREFIDVIEAVKLHGTHHR